MADEDEPEIGPPPDWDEEDQDGVTGGLTCAICCTPGDARWTAFGEYGPWVRWYACFSPVGLGCHCPPGGGEPEPKE